jgi:TolB-like protein/Flp pilus assembly protein TadD
MLVGNLPFGGDSDQAVIFSITKQEPRPIPEGSAEMSKGLKSVVSKALAKRVEDRYQSAAELLADLRGVQEGLESAVQDRPGTAFREHGLRGRRVAWSVAGIAAAGLTLWVTFGREDTGTTQIVLEPGSIESVAVLPLEDLAGDPAQEYFASGMTEMLLNNLGQVGEFDVISLRTYRGDRPLREIAGELDIDGLVEGTVLRIADRVRITARLVDARSGLHVWSADYERSLSDVLSMQSEVASAIAQQIQANVSLGRLEEAASVRSVDPEAYEAYLVSLHHWNQRRPEALGQAMEQATMAIELDPTFAPAHVVLADCLNLLGSIEVGVLPPKEAMPRARRAALGALAIDETLGAAHASLGHVRMTYDWDRKAAEASFLRAIELSPNYATAHHWYSLLLSLTGRSEASITEAELALTLDPLQPILGVALGNRYFNDRQYEAAMRRYQEVLELAPDFVPARIYLGRAYEQVSLFDEAIGEFERAIKLTGGNPLSSAFLARSYALSGREERARDLLAGLESLADQRYVPPFAFAIIHSGLGEEEEAIDQMYKAYEERSGLMIYLDRDPLADDFRSNPRFGELLQRVGWN